MIRTVLVVALFGCGSSAKPAPQEPHHAPVADHANHANHAHHAAEHGQMPHRFEDANRWAKVFDDPARDDWQKPDEVIAALALTPAMTVADIGAGTGYFRCGSHAPCPRAG